MEDEALKQNGAKIDGLRWKPSNRIGTSCRVGPFNSLKMLIGDWGEGLKNIEFGCENGDYIRNWENADCGDWYVLPRVKT